MIGRPPSADWPAVLATATAIVDEAPTLPTMPELWQALLDCGALLGGRTQWSGLRHQIREAQLRGQFPKLPRAKSGPAKGTPWNEDRWLAWEQHAEDIDPCEAEKRTEACFAYLQGALPTFPHGLLLTPQQMAAFARDGWGYGVVYRAVHRLQRQGRAVAVVRCSVPLVTLVRAA